MSAIIERRLIAYHTSGAYPGLRQIIGLVTTNRPLPDKLENVALWPDDRKATMLRLRTTDKYAAYREQGNDE